MGVARGGSVERNGFSDVDASGRAPELVSYLDHAHAGLEHAERRLRAGLPLVAGDRVLDLGCGAGHELLALEREGMRAVGVDLSAAMVEASRRRLLSEGVPVRLVRADVAGLPFRDRTFDACRIERVLQHVADPAAVLGEVRRVLRPGGSVAVLEPDWASFTLASADPGTAEAVAAEVGATIRHRRVGRDLRRLLHRARMCGVRTEVELVTYEDLETLGRMLSLQEAADRAVASGRVLRAAAERLMAEQNELSESGAVHATLHRSVLAWALRP